MDFGKIFTYLAKNPTVLMVVAIVALLPVFLTGAGIYSAVTALGRPLAARQTYTDSCAGNYQQTINDNFTDKDIDKAQILTGCPTADGTAFDVSKWIALQLRAQTDYDKNMKFDQDEIDELKKLAYEAATANVNAGADTDAAKADIDDQFKDFLAKYKDKEIYKAIADWAQESIDNHTYDGDLAGKAVQYALSRVGESYVSVRGLGSWNNEKDAYCAISPHVMGGPADTFQCGFDCSSFVGWAYLKAQDWNTQKYGLYSKNGGTIDPWSFGASREYQYFATEGHGAKVSASELMPGDLIFVDTDGGGLNNSGHVAMYVGKFNGVSRWVEASNDTSNIRILNTNTPWFNGYGTGYVRPYPSTTTPDVAGAHPTTPSTGAVATYKAYAKSYMPTIGLKTSEFDMLDQLFTQESSWNPYIANSSSGAYGIPQSLPGSKMASECSSSNPDCWRTDYKAQIRWGLKYIKNKYGSVKSAYDLEFCNRTINYTPKCGWY
jgi:cell wall-associated NlpC family hydrolase